MAAFPSVISCDKVRAACLRKRCDRALRCRAHAAAYCSSSIDTLPVTPLVRRRAFSRASSRMLDGLPVNGGSTTKNVDMVAATDTAAL